MDIMTLFFYRLLCIVSAIVTIIPYHAPAAEMELDHSADNTNYPFIFVEGFWGWGEESSMYDTLPYWGFLLGDMVDALNENGYTAAAPNISPVGSCWDRTCELYAMLTGTLTDYGAAHSAEYGHKRYGKDYTGKAILENWDSENKINIIAHSFGGPTASLLASLLAYGDEAEMAAGGSVSPLFTGGKSDYIHSITGIAGAYNGTSLINCAPSINAGTYAIRDWATLGGISPAFLAVRGATAFFRYITSHEFANPDTAIYDMTPVNSVTLNEQIKEVDSIYYFTIPCCCTYDCGTNHLPDTDVAPFSMWLTCMGMGFADEGHDEVIDRTWQANDGIVNTVSEYGPNDAERVFVENTPSAALAGSFSTGVYNVFPTYTGSHMSLMGNLTDANPDALPYMSQLVEMINAL